MVIIRRHYQSPLEKELCMKIEDVEKIQILKQKSLEFLFCEIIYGFKIKC